MQKMERAQRLSEAVLQHEAIMESFKKEAYTEAFLEYKKQYYPVIAHISACWEEKEETQRELYLEEVVQEYLKELQEALEAAGRSKAARHNKTDAYRMIQALYTVPMLRATGLPVAEPLAERLVEGWKREHPKYAFKLGDYETLESGFDKKQFCYITTAVCETLGRADNCYELTMFRQFRDGYLRKQPGGEELIREYYQEAPGIIQKLDALPDREAVYRGIWEEHLKPCLSLLEQGEDAACQERYIHMMECLRKKGRLCGKK